jgi:hypothetical protein
MRGRMGRPGGLPHEGGLGGLGRAGLEAYPTRENRYEAVDWNLGLP